MGSEPTKKTRNYECKQKKVFEQAIKRLKSETKILEEEKKNILDLVEHLQAKGVGILRVVKYINHMLVVARIATKPLKQFDRKDVESLVSKINTSPYTAHTKHDYLIIIKKYFQWLLNFDEEMHDYPPQVRWIKTTLKKKRLLPEALLTSEELKNLVEATENQRDRAFVLMDYDGGFRIHELLRLKIVNITFDKYSAFAVIEDGKTGARRVRLTVSAPALRLWLSVHPLRTDQNSPLWIGIGSVGRNEELTYDGARALLRRLAKKTGLKKRIYTQLFRHTRATELAKIMSEASLKQHFGWVSDSEMPGNYVHLSGRDIDGVLLEAHGIKVEKEDQVKMAITLAECPRCRSPITSGAQLCVSCGTPLSNEAAIKIEEEKSIADKLMDLLMKDAEVRQLLAKKIAELSSQPHPSSQVMS